MGDTADNIPGAPGVGPKTAMKLISEYGSVEEVFRNTDKLKGKLKEIIENNREQIELSKTLATIDINVPVDFREEDLILETPDREKLKKLFDELEFRTIASEVLSEIDRNNIAAGGGSADAPSSGLRRALSSEVNSFRRFRLESRHRHRGA